MSLIVKAPAKKEKQSPYAYAWITIGEECFQLDVPEKIKMRIWRMRGKIVWYIKARVGGQTYYGERYNLESAAKACDTMLYKKFPHVWTVTDPRVIIEPWKGDLTFEENGTERREVDDRSRDDAGLQSAQPPLLSKQVAPAQSEVRQIQVGRS